MVDWLELVAAVEKRDIVMVVVVVAAAVERRWGDEWL